MKRSFVVSIVAVTLLGIAIPFVHAAVPTLNISGPPAAAPGAPDLGTFDKVKARIGTFIGWGVELFWVLVVAMIIYTAYLYLTGSGNEDTMGKAHKQLRWTMVAIAVALLSTVIPSLVRSLLSPNSAGGASSNSATPSNSGTRSNPGDTPQPWNPW